MQVSQDDKILVEVCAEYLKNKGITNPYSNSVKILNKNIVVADLKKEKFYKQNKSHYTNVLYPNLKGKRFTRIAFYKEGYLDGSKIFYVDSKTKSILLIE